MLPKRDKPVTRQMVARWLHSDPAQRREPSLSDGLLLQSVWQKLNP